MSGGGFTWRRDRLLRAAVVAVLLPHVAQENRAGGCGDWGDSPCWWVAGFLSGTGFPEVTAPAPLACHKAYLKTVICLQHL